MWNSELTLIYFLFFRALLVSTGDYIFATIDCVSTYSLESLLCIGKICILDAAICSSCKINTLFQFFPVRESQNNQKELELIYLFHAFVHFDNISSSGINANNLENNAEVILWANNRWSGDKEEPQMWTYYKIKVFNGIVI